jgi:hypothetical protein
VACCVALLAFGIPATKLFCQEVGPGETARQAYAKDISLPAIKKESLVLVAFDVEVYRHAANDWRDLRLFDSQHRQVPFVIHRLLTDETRQHRVRDHVRKPRIRRLADDELEISFEIDPKQHPKPVEGIRLATSLTNFEHHVTVEKRGDDDTWQTLVEEALIYDYTQYMDVQNTEIPFPVDAKHGSGGSYRVRIRDVTQEQQSQFREIRSLIRGGSEKEREEAWIVNRQPFRIEQIEFWYDIESVTTSKPKLTDYPLTITGISQDPKSKATMVDVETEREPIIQISLRTTDANFSRKVSLWEMPTSADEKPRLLVRQTLSKFNIGSIKRKDTTLSLADFRSRNYRIEIDNGDSPALSDISLTASGWIYAAAFLGRPGESYQLAYGKAFQEAARHDVAAIEAALHASVLPVTGSLDKSRPFTTSLPLPGGNAWIIKPWLGWFAITLLLILLGFGLYQAARRLDRIPP